MNARAERLRAKVEAERALPASERLLNMLRATHSTPEANALLDAYRAEVLAEAIEAARSEYLTASTGESEDDSYNQAVTDVIAGIEAIAEAGESRG